MGIVILYALCTAFVLVEKLQLPYRFDGYLNFKPFNCQTCLSGWVALPVSLLMGYTWQTPFLMCVAMVTSYLFELLTKEV